MGKSVKENYFQEIPAVSAAFAPYRVRPSSSPLPYTVFAPTLFEFDPIKSSSPPDRVMSKLVVIEHCKQVRTKTNFEF